MPSPPTQFHPPIDLSDLPGYAPAQRRHVSGFVGRVSTKDNQDPQSSLARQVSAASALLDDGESFVGHWWDVESGMLPPDLRGLGDADAYAALNVAVPRDGGLAELREHAAAIGVTRIIAEQSDRLARAMVTSLTIEHELERQGIAVIYADEPTGGTVTGRLRVRRSAQMEAEILRHAMLDRSMGGQYQHAGAGFQHGPPCYAYVTEIDEEATAALPPNRFGVRRPKKRLALDPDPRRQDTVRQVYEWRLRDRLTTAEIRRHLAAFPDRYPLGKGETWRIHRVEEMLSQPKYTGHQVYNRKAKRTRGGRRNPIAEWVWSPEPAHPAIITLDEWHKTQLVTAALKEESMSGLERVRRTAQAHGLGMRPVRSSTTHIVYAIGDREIVVPRGDLPPSTADAIIQSLQEAS